MSQAPAPSSTSANTPLERWSHNAGDAALATLLIPPHATRERRFEISVAMTVKVPADAEAGSCWHEMSVAANGAQQWRRRVPSHNAGSFDGLDYRFTRSVPVGETLRLVVAAQVRGVQRRSVDIEAEEM